MHELILQSEEFGRETFRFESPDAARIAYATLVEEAKQCSAQDGIERKVSLVEARLSTSVQPELTERQDK